VTVSGEPGTDSTNRPASSHRVSTPAVQPGRNGISTPRPHAADDLYWRLPASVHGRDRTPGRHADRRLSGRSARRAGDRFLGDPPPTRRRARLRRGLRLHPRRAGTIDRSCRRTRRTDRRDDGRGTGRDARGCRRLGAGDAPPVDVGATRQRGRRVGRSGRPDRATPRSHTRP
jgi:hypothetical protein